MLGYSIIRRSNSPWSSPLHLAHKHEPNTWRPRGDFRRLNAITMDDRYPVPHIRYITAKFHDKKVFARVDLQKANLQVPVSPDDIPKTTVTLPFDLFKFVRMPFYLKGASSTFQKYMDTIFANVTNVDPFIDDLILASETEEQHMFDLEQVIQLILDNNLKISVMKCGFFKDSLKLLGFQINSVGVTLSDDKVEAIRSLVSPDKVSDLRRYMGMLNFFGHLTF